MPKKLDELSNQLGFDEHALRFKKSHAFLSGQSEVLDLGGKSPVAIWLMRLLMFIGAIALVGILGLFFYIWMWDSSPLTTTVEARVTGIKKKSQGGDVSFEYKVNGQTYEADQYANSTKRAWQGENSTAEVVYLNFMPSAAKLKSTIERVDWMMLVLGPIMPLGFLIGGYMGLQAAKRMSRIEDNATHLLSGTVSKRIRSKGFVIVQYQTTSPESHDALFGGVQIGKLEPALAGMQVGARVAVVYASDKEHTLL